VLQTRIAVGSSVVVVGNLVGQGVTQENAAIGETTNLVARLQALAEPNTLVKSDPHTPLSYYCSPHHQNSALYPHISQLNHAAGIERRLGRELFGDGAH
jgi:hypothetical protein